MWNKDSSKQNLFLILKTSCEEAFPFRFWEKWGSEKWGDLQTLTLIWDLNPAPGLNPKPAGLPSNSWLSSSWLMGLRQGVSASPLTSGPGNPLLGGRAVYGRVFSGIPDLSPLDARSGPHPHTKWWHHKMALDIANVPRGQNRQVEN